MPFSAARQLRNSQSVWPAWLTSGNTVLVESTRPIFNPARCATWVAMSDAVACT